MDLYPYKGRPTSTNTEESFPIVKEQEILKVTQTQESLQKIKPILKKSENPYQKKNSLSDEYILLFSNQKNLTNKETPSSICRHRNTKSLFMNVVLQEKLKIFKEEAFPQPNQQNENKIKSLYKNGTGKNRPFDSSFQKSSYFLKTKLERKIFNDISLRKTVVPKEKKTKIREKLVNFFYRPSSSKSKSMPKGSLDHSLESQIRNDKILNRYPVFNLKENYHTSLAKKSILKNDKKIIDKIKEDEKNLSFFKAKMKVVNLISSSRIAKESFEEVKHNSVLTNSINSFLSGQGSFRQVTSRNQKLNKKSNDSDSMASKKASVEDLTKNLKGSKHFICSSKNSPVTRKNSKSFTPKISRLIFGQNNNNRRDTMETEKGFEVKKEHPMVKDFLHKSHQSYQPSHFLSKLSKGTISPISMKETIKKKIFLKKKLLAI